jgi:hypothetical protein
MHAGLSWFRLRQRSLTRAVLALFVLAWLQIAALPCVMAHAPDAGMPDGSEHCGYCPEGDEASSAGPAQCDFPHDPGVDARYSASLFIAPTAVHAVVPVVAASGELVLLRSLDADRYRTPPLTLRYCRFIE